MDGRQAGVVGRQAGVVGRQAGVVGRHAGVVGVSDAYDHSRSSGDSGEDGGRHRFTFPARPESNRGRG